MNTRGRRIAVWLTLFPFVSCLFCRKDEQPSSILPLLDHSLDTHFSIRNPFWSRDGSRLYGIGSSPDREGNGIYAVDSGGGEARPVFEDTLEKIFPTLSPDGMRIAYLAAEPGRIWCCSHVWIVEADGSLARDLTPFFGNWEFLRWSPDSRFLLFDGAVEDSGAMNYQIIRADVQTGALVQLTHGSSGNRDATYLSDGRRIAFLSGRIMTDYGGKVFVMNADGTNPVAIDTSRTASVAPRPSPRRNDIVFSWGLGGEGNAGAYSLNLDSTELPAQPSSYRLFFPGSELSTMQWSPDGNQVALPIATSAITQDVYIVRRDGTGLRRITTNLQAYFFSYLWNNNSNKLIFQAKDRTDDSFHIYVYDFVMEKLMILSITHH